MPLFTRCRAVPSGPSPLHLPPAPRTMPLLVPWVGEVRSWVTAARWLRGWRRGCLSFGRLLLPPDQLRPPFLGMGLVEDLLPDSTPVLGVHLLEPPEFWGKEFDP